MRLSLIAAGLLAAVSLVAHAQQDIPPFDTHVADPAGVLGPELLPAMEMMLTQIAAIDGTRIAVLSVADLQGEPVSQYAYRALYEWGGGDGATQSSLILLAPDGVVVLVTGGELLARMSRAEAEAVLVDTLLPTAAQSDMTTAVINAAQAVMMSLTSEEGGATGDPFAVVAHFGPDGTPEVIDEISEDLPSLAAEGENFELTLDPQHWINDMTTALSFAFAAAGRDPLGFLAQARGELLALPAVLDVASSQPTVPQQVVTRFILLGLSIGLCVFAWRVTQTAAVLLGVMGMLGGLWIWQLSGFAALALCVMAAGLLLLPLSRLALILFKGAASRDNVVKTTGSGNAVGPSQSYQEWLAVQKAKSAHLTRTPDAAAATKPAATKGVTAKPAASMPTAPTSPTSGGRLPGGMIDNRSVPKAGSENLGTRLSNDRERLHQAGVATPAIDQLLRSRNTLNGLSKRKIQMIVIGGAIAVVIFGPIAVFGLIVAGVLWGRKLWSQVKPASMNTGDFLKQVAKEAEAASKLRH